jgi:hypothetical protein
MRFWLGHKLLLLVFVRSVLSGDSYLVDLNPAKGRERAGCPRYVIIVSPREFNLSGTPLDPLAVEDPLPDAPLFLEPDWYVNIPLEQTYMASWDVTPKPIRELVTRPTAEM